MNNHTLVNKTIYLLITHPFINSASAPSVSIQKILFKSNGQYDVTCVAAGLNDATTDVARHGKYNIKEQSDHKLILDADEETGPYVGKYQLKLDWFDELNGKFHCKKLDDGSMSSGLFQVVE